MQTPKVARFASDTPELVGTSSASEEAHQPISLRHANTSAMANQGHRIKDRHEEFHGCSSSATCDENTPLIRSVSEKSIIVQKLRPKVPRWQVKLNLGTLENWNAAWVRARMGKLEDDSDSEDEEIQPQQTICHEPELAKPTAKTEDQPCVGLVALDRHLWRKPLLKFHEVVTVVGLSMALTVCAVLLALVVLPILEEAGRNLAASHLLLCVVYGLCIAAVSSFQFTNPGFVERQEGSNDNGNPSRLPTLATSAHGEEFTVAREWCYTCRVYRPLRASHCGNCGKCVRAHDHHCPILGNCTGAMNYRCYMAALLTLFIVFVYTIIICICGICTIGVPSASWFHRSQTYGKIVIRCAEMLVCCLLLLVHIFGLVDNLQLVYFHLKIISMGVTTREYFKPEKVPKSKKDENLHVYHEGSIMQNVHAFLSGTRREFLASESG